MFFLIIFLFYSIKEAYQKKQFHQTKQKKSRGMKKKLHETIKTSNRSHLKTNIHGL